MTGKMPVPRRRRRGAGVSPAGQAKMEATGEANVTTGKMPVPRMQRRGAGVSPAGQAGVERMSGQVCFCVRACSRLERESPSPQPSPLKGEGVRALEPAVPAGEARHRGQVSLSYK